MNTTPPEKDGAHTFGRMQQLAVDVLCQTTSSPQNPQSSLKHKKEELKQSLIVIHVPFDGFSCAITVPEILYSDNLLKFTDELEYVPYFDTLIPETDNDRLLATLEVLIK